MRKKLTTVILLIIFASFMGLVHVQAAADPIGYWKFDDGSGNTPIDSSGNNIIGSFLTPNPTWSTDVPSAITFSDPYSLDFSGTHDGVTFSWPSGLNFSNNAPRSFSFWYKPISSGENDAGSYDRIISWSSDQFEIAGTMGDPTVHRVTFYDGAWRDTGYDLAVGTWYHLTVTFDGSTIKLFVDNDVKFSGSSGGRALSGTMAISTRENGHNEGINGRIDDVRVYNYALTTNQIENLTAGSNNPDAPPSTPTPTPTVTVTPTVTAYPIPTTTVSTVSSSALMSTASPCSSQIPDAAPNLFQISTSPTSATLYFTPVNPATGYSIMYGPYSDANQHGVTFDYTNTSGASSYTINELAKGTRYYFKVQAKNNCATGNWSQILSQTTTGIMDLSSLLPKESLKVISTELTSSPRKAHPKKTEIKPTTEIEDYDLTIKIINEGEPVIGAHVEIHSTPRKTITDKDGIARFSKIERGRHTVYLSYKEYRGEEKIKVDGTDQKIDMTFTIELKPSSTFFSSAAIRVIVVLCILLFSLLILLWIKYNNT